MQKGSKKYYGKQGEYLHEHALYLQQADLQKDLDFIVKALGIKKHKPVLDIACGQGRHVHGFTRRGYSVDGVDFSSYFLAMAKKTTDKSLKIQPTFYRSDIKKFVGKKKYTYAYWFFSDLADIDLPKALQAISRNLEVGGRLLLDTDSIFRLLSFLEKHKKSSLVFDAQRMELMDTEHDSVIPYPVFFQWQAWLKEAGLRIERVIGDYQFQPYSVSSPRLIMIIKK